MSLLDPLLQGILLGGLYTIFAVGLSLIFGVMKLVNIAHGDFIVLAAYLAHLVITATSLSPVGGAYHRGANDGPRLAICCNASS